MNFKKIMARLGKIAAIFAVCETAIAFFILVFFRTVLLIEIVSLVGGIILILLVVLAIFLVGYLVAVIPDNRVITKLVAKLNKLSEEKSREKALRIKLEKENSKLSAELEKCQKQISANGILKTVSSIPNEPTPTFQEHVNDAS